MRHSSGRRKRKQDISTQSHTVEETGRLNDLLLSVIDETMKQVFKEDGAKAVYDYLEKNLHLRREEVVEKPEIFFAGLERLLGSGTPPIEKLILKNLYSKPGLKFREKKGFKFSDYVEELRKRCG